MQIRLYFLQFVFFNSRVPLTKQFKFDIFGFNECKRTFPAFLDIGENFTTQIKQVAGLRYQLLSVSKMVKRGVRTTFDECVAWITNRTKSYLLQES